MCSFVIFYLSFIFWIVTFDIKEKQLQLLAVDLTVTDIRVHLRSYVSVVSCSQKKKQTNKYSSEVQLIPTSPNRRATQSESDYHQQDREMGKLNFCTMKDFEFLPPLAKWC